MASVCAVTLTASNLTCHQPICSDETVLIQVNFQINPKRWCNFGTPRTRHIEVWSFVHTSATSLNNQAKCSWGSLFSSLPALADVRVWSIVGPHKSICIRVHFNNVISQFDTFPSHWHKDWPHFMCSINYNMIRIHNLKHKAMQRPTCTMIL